MTTKTWKETAAERRDSRHTRGPDSHRPVPGKKDTKRWCKGHVGREHKAECRDYQPLKRTWPHHPNLFAGWKLLVCIVCGKELDYYRPMTWSGRSPQPPKPDWVK